MQTDQSTTPLDFNNTTPTGGLRLVQDCYNLARRYQQPRNDQIRKDYAMLRGYINMAKRDPSKAHVFIPKLWALVRNKIPREVKALFGIRPYIPFESCREDFRPVSDVINDMLDAYLVQSNFKARGMAALNIKVPFGTAFMESTPYYQIVDREDTEEFELGDQVYTQATMTQKKLLRFRQRMLAPWEVYVDPFATGLEENGQCRFVVKPIVTSKREIYRLWQQGSYPKLDIEKFMGTMAGNGMGDYDDIGRQILAAFGLTQPGFDTDMGVWFRLECDAAYGGRYIDVWNMMTVLSDDICPWKNLDGEPFINLSRVIHYPDSHTQNQFWAIGEIKPNEMLAMLLNDLASQAINTWNMISQPGIAFKENSITPEELAWQGGGRYRIRNTSSERPLSDAFQVISGSGLPQDHYRMIESAEQWIDLGSNNYGPNRGEPIGGQRTLGEYSLLKEAGQEPEEFMVTQDEEIFLKSHGEKMLSQMNQMASMDDVVELVGPERAAIMRYMNPKMIPGGYLFPFKGSDRVTNLLVKQRNLKELAQPLQTLLDSGKYELAAITMRAFEFQENEIMRIIGESQQMMMVQAQQQAIQQERNFQLEKEKVSGKNKENTPPQEATRNAKEGVAA